jgi:hypothetical protein
MESLPVEKVDLTSTAHNSFHKRCRRIERMRGDVVGHESGRGIPLTIRTFYANLAITHADLAAIVANEPLARVVAAQVALMEAAAQPHRPEATSEQRAHELIIGASSRVRAIGRQPADLEVRL